MLAKSPILHPSSIFLLLICIVLHILMSLFEIIVTCRYLM